MLVEHGYECHAAEAKIVQAGSRVDHRGRLLKGGESGAAIVPELVEKSWLLKTLQFRAPFRILHGSADTSVRPQQAADFQAILDKNRVRNERTLDDGQGHPIAPTQREQVFAAIRAWFEKHGAKQPGRNLPC